ncbi:MAG: ubiquitin-like domain-containing protein [Anaerolineales bacterium]|nr:ubiquitin-like domain-containing protein [Anaerolineales bacterium]
MNVYRRRPFHFIPFLPVLLVLLGLLAACRESKQQLFILEGETLYTVTTEAATLGQALDQAGLALGPDDRLLFRGQTIAADAPVSACARPCLLQIRRAVPLTVQTPSKVITLFTSANSIAEALEEAGFALSPADRFSLPLETPIVNGLSVIWTPARELTVQVDGLQLRIRSAAQTVGEALAEAGLPLIGLDRSEPAENQPLPENGMIRIIRVVETITTTPKILPYEKRMEFSAELELDQTQLLQSGEPGLALARVRTRLEDGVAVAEVVEGETMVRPPQDQITLYGTRVVMKTAVVDGITITYWRALPFYATSYHPVTSDITASGKRVRIGLAGIDPRYIPYGTQMYVPGYGYAEAADTGAISGRWIDLAYPTEAYVPWHRWVTVYFLWPPPASFPYYIPPPCSTLTGYCPPPP